jgi:hypothetical protein
MLLASSYVPSRTALIQHSDGVVLPRRAGRRHPGPRQEPQEMVGAASLQGLALERLHASRRLAPARRQQQEEEEKNQHQPPRLPPPATSRLETAGAHLCRTYVEQKQRKRWRLMGREANPAASMECEEREEESFGGRIYANGEDRRGEVVTYMGCLTAREVVM